jgi:DNA repair protein RecO (recombination protein O)
LPARAERCDAIVLRCVDYRDADRIVTLLTRQHGKVSALARGARKSKKRFAGALEGFAVISVELALGSAELGRLDSAQVTRAFPALLADLARLTAAGALLRRCRELLPEHVPDEPVFDEVLAMLEALPGTDAANWHLACELRLLSLAGFAPLLEICGGCGKQPAAAQSASFDPQRGSIVCRACGGGPVRVRARVRQRMCEACDGAFREVAALDWPTDERQEAERLVADFIAQRISRNVRPQ